MKKIVVAESSPTIKSVADNLLKQNGYETVCTSDGLQAWEVINSDRPDLVLAGLNISGINGIELCKQMSADRILGGIPVVIMVGAKDNFAEDDIKAAGARGKLKKPFSPRDILLIVKKLIGEGNIANQDPSVAAAKSRSTKYKAEVISTTKHLEQSGNEVYNLDWNDLNDTGTQAPQNSASNRSGSADVDDQEIEIVHDQFDLASLNDIEDKKETKYSHPESKDEDYDWFIGEMKKDSSNTTGAIKIGADKQNQETPAAQTPPLPAEKPVTKEDIESDNAVLFTTDEKKPEDKIASVKPDLTGPAEGNGQISEDDISKIADKVTQNLASAIVASIDNQKIIEAIRAVIKK